MLVQQPATTAMCSCMQDGVLVDGASMLLGTMAHLLTNEAAVKCFHATAAALQPGGLFVLELASPDDLFDGAFALGDVWDAATADGQKLVVEYGTEGDDFDPISQVRMRSAATFPHVRGVAVSSLFLYMVPQRHGLDFMSGSLTGSPAISEDQHGAERWRE